MNYLKQLNLILKASGISQEELAQKLGVSFVSLNSWINERSVPRKKMQAKIELLFLQFVGQEDFDAVYVESKKNSARKAKMDAKELLSHPSMLDNLALHLTYNTNSIEGSTMTLSDTKEVLFDKRVLTNRTQIEQIEAINHRTALLWLIDKIAKEGCLILDESTIKQLHLILMSGIMSNAGMYRNHSVRIMGANVALANYHKIPELIIDLMDKINNINKDNIVEALAETHAMFEKIHPFSDGNGRIGRLLMVGVALNACVCPPIVSKERKLAYYKYLEIAQSQEKLTPLEMFIAESVLEANAILRAK